MKRRQEEERNKYTSMAQENTQYFYPHYVESVPTKREIRGVMEIKAKSGLKQCMTSLT